MSRIAFYFFLVPLINFAQVSFETQIDSISTAEEAENFINSYNSGKLYVFNEEKHKTRLATDLFKLSKGGKKVIRTEFKTTVYKIIDKSKTLHNRVHYILLDGNTMSLQDIEDRRNDIVSKFQNGYDFKTLAKYYSMDINANKGGDSGWFAEGAMPIQFQTAVASHQLNDIFKLDIPEAKAYYVILKTHEAKNIDEITVLKFSETAR
ncbi:peptidylprolyl isomerase [uncultured Winogradskyella sp.]|uniref:peptidylprolyl isomerase n=1 Tax=uncultured Winogradskyella sp. TaxID=395353 RepID=UPI003516C744